MLETGNNACVRCDHAKPVITLQLASGSKQFDGCAQQSQAVCIGQELALSCSVADCVAWVLAHQVLPAYASSTYGVAASPMAAGSPGQSPVGPFGSAEVPHAGPLGRRHSPAFTPAALHRPHTPQSLVMAAIDKLAADDAAEQVRCCATCRSVTHEAASMGHCWQGSLLVSIKCCRCSAPHGHQTFAPCHSAYGLPSSPFCPWLQAHIADGCHGSL